ncbi:MAG: ankyrin repeat domain-containing protein [Gemmatimonadetes bacterium]|nr:ankyrin repeat domain-containing protein [Gemmatimonadota bacterium]
MSTTQAQGPMTEQQAAAGSVRRFHQRPLTVRIAYGTAAVAAVPFLVTLITNTRGIAGLAALLLAVAGALLAVHIRGRAAQRPQTVRVDDEGIAVERSGSARQLAWGDVAALHHDRIGMSIRVTARAGATPGVRGMKPVDALTFDADLDDTAGLLEAALHHIEASRADADTARQARPLYVRPLRGDAVTLSIAALGVVLALMVWPPLFAVSALALAGLAWRSIMTPFSVAIDDTAVWVMRPLGRDVIPLRAIRSVHLGMTGRLPSPAVFIDRRDGGRVGISGMGPNALPLFDGVLGAHRRDRAAQSSGGASKRMGSAVQRSGSRHSALATCAAGMLALLAVAWIAVMTGIPLRNATSHGSALTARIAMLPGAPLNAAGRDGRSALHIAAALDRDVIAGALISRGADVDVRPEDSAGPAPLHEAAGHGHAAIVARLIAAGADVNAPGTLQRTPLAQAALADAPGDTTVVRMLLDAGADPDQPDAEGRTALHYAALNGHALIVRQLTRAGGAIEKPDSLGHRPLHAALSMRQQDALAALLAAGADANAPGRSGRTALAQAAADNAPLSIVAALLDAGAQVSIADDEGWNAAQLAATANNIELLELFARRRVRLDATDGRIAPALWLAVDAGHTDAVRALLRGGASPRLRWQGKSPAELARSRRNATMLALMQMR